MAPSTDRRPRGSSMTQRLGFALSLGAVFVATLLGLLGAELRSRSAREADAAAELTLARSLAERAAPLLERDDRSRLAMLATVARDHLQGRVLVLDGRGKVAVDTAQVPGEHTLGLLAAGGAEQREHERQDGGRSRETLVPIRYGGELTGELRLQCDVPPTVVAFAFDWFGLGLLACLSLVAVATVMCHHWSARVRSATDALIRLSAGEVAGGVVDLGDGDLQDLGNALREMERGMQDGLQRVGEGYAAMAQQVVDGLESRRLVVPGHGERTARLASRLAERLQLLPADRQDLELACRLVDLGKAWVRAAILQKQGRLSELEAESLARHPSRAGELLDCVPGLRRTARIVRHQLERYDGFGGPDGLRGDRIPLGSRILAIAAAFDQLTQSGDSSCDWQQALLQMNGARGEVFDPWLLDLFAEGVTQEPPTDAADRPVMIVPGGNLPWRAHRNDATEDAGDDAEEAVADDIEVLLDDPRRDTDGSADR
jgi:HD-GYP domain-containing protein (c-di-GMP phosphodiesterase class II)